MPLASYWQTIANLSKICVGTGILALPYSFLCGGVIFSPVGLFFVMTWNLYSAYCLLDCDDMVRERLEGKGLGGIKYFSNERKEGKETLSRYAVISMHAIGDTGPKIIDLILLILLLGVCTSYQVASWSFTRTLIGEDWKVAFKGGEVMAVWGMCKNGGMENLSRGSVVGLFAILGSVGGIVYNGYMEGV